MKILVTGSTGLLAKGLEETADASVEIVGAHLRDYKVRDPRARHLRLDIRDKAAVDSLFAAERFDAVIHAAGLATVDHVERHPEEGRLSNLQGTIHIADACRRHGSDLVFVSTNAVFDGRSAPYAEDAPTNPLHHYGRIKLACEEAARERVPGCTVARPILMYGWNHSVNRPNPVTWVYDKLLRGEPVSLVDDVWENPLFNIQCGRALWEIVRRRPGGTFHLAGAERVNRYELGLKVAAAFGLDASLVKRADSSQFPGIAQRPPDTTFATGKMERDLGVKPMTLDEGLTAMREAMEARF